MLKVGQEEKQIAICNQKDHQEIPDGLLLLSKRSHGHITWPFLQCQLRCGFHIRCGNKTNELFYMGIFCCQLHRREEMNYPSLAQILQNWNGSSMQISLHLEFMASESMHGLHYTEVIGDGDSSVLHTIQTIRYGKDVQKVEPCCQVLLWHLI